MALIGKADSISGTVKSSRLGEPGSFTQDVFSSYFSMLTILRGYYPQSVLKASPQLRDGDSNGFCSCKFAGHGPCVLSMGNEEQQEGSASHSLVAAAWDQAEFISGYLGWGCFHLWQHRLPEAGQATKAFRCLQELNLSLPYSVVCRWHWSWLSELSFPLQ